MKNPLSLLILLTVGLTPVAAQDATTTVQVAPSDQVVYPDASQILNKTEPKPTLKPVAALTASTLPSSKPLLGATPVPARPLAPAKPGVAAAAAPLASGSQGWYLRWSVTGDEAGVKAWAATQGSDRVTALGGDLWEVLKGPLAADDLQKAIGEAGRAQLVKR
jgi:hypothetical protein